MKLYNEIKEAMQEVMNAEANARAWQQEARSLMKNVDTIIRAAQKIDPEAAALTIPEIKKQLREDLTAEPEAAEAGQPDPEEIEQEAHCPDPEEVDPEEPTEAPAE